MSSSARGVINKGTDYTKRPAEERKADNAGAPNDRFRGNICSEPSRMAKIVGIPRTAKNFENVSW